MVIKDNNPTYPKARRKKVEEKGKRYILTYKYVLSFSYLVMSTCINFPHKGWEHQLTLARNVTSIVFTVLTKSVFMRDLEGPTESMKRDLSSTQFL